MNVESVKWLIWSHERLMWWKPNSAGYTYSHAEAGRYTFAEAIDIVQLANLHNISRDTPSETMLPDA